jgi:hypothetical protein
MVVQVRAISKRATQDLAREFEMRAAEMRDRVGRRIADVIVDRSPVDTGTYIMAHVAGDGRVSGDVERSSGGKPRGRDGQQFRNLARGNLHRSVSAAAIQAGNEIFFRNRAEHAPFVEYIGWKGRQADHVYGIARAATPQIIRDVAAAMGMTTR